MVTVGIILTKPCQFSRFTQRIGDYADDPTTVFLFSDEHPIIARYLHRIQFRRCRVYHTGDVPKHSIGKYTNKGRFISRAEIYASIREESDVVIDENSI